MAVAERPPVGGKVCNVAPGKAEWMLRYLGVQAELRSLRHGSGVFNLDDANEIDRVLEEAEGLLKDNQPHLH